MPHKHKRVKTTDAKDKEGQCVAMSVPLPVTILNIVLQIQPPSNQSCETSSSIQRLETRYEAPQLQQEKEEDKFWCCQG